MGNRKSVNEVCTGYQKLYQDLAEAIEAVEPESAVGAGELLGQVHSGFDELAQAVNELPEPDRYSVGTVLAKQLNDVVFLFRLITEAKLRDERLREADHPQGREAAKRAYRLACSRAESRYLRVLKQSLPAIAA